MNLDAVLEDLEASFEQLRHEPTQLQNLKPVGFDTVTFGPDHFSGFIAGSTIWRLTLFTEPIRLEVGVSATGHHKATEVLRSLIGRWLRVEAATGQIQGQLLAVEGKLLLFRGVCVPLKSFKFAELHAVDNPER